MKTPAFCRTVLLGLLGALPIATTHAQQLVNPNVTPETRALKQFMDSVYKQKIISGQVDDRYLQYIKDNTGGKEPAMMGYDFSNIETCKGNTTGRHNDTDKAIAWVKQRGGIAQFQWHWAAPRGGCDYYTDKTTFDTDVNILNALNSPGSQDYNLLVNDMDRVANELKRLQAAGVPILWRPFHESEGKWFWWGTQGGATMRRLWDFMYDRYTRHHGLNNLIWVWNSYGTNKENWYPGNGTVDIISYDYEEANSWSGYQQLFGSSGKLFGLGEEGRLPDPANFTARPWSYFLTWAYMVEDPSVNSQGKNTRAWLRQVYNDPRVITLSDLNIQPDNDNLARGKAATASTTEGAGFEATKAVDGSTLTRWASSAADANWFTVDLGNIYEINRVVLNWEAAFGRAYQLQVSSDGINWQSIYSTAAGDGGTDDLTGLRGTGRYVRMQGIARGTTWGYSLWELKVYGQSITASSAASSSSSLSSAPVLTNIALNKPALSSGNDDAARAAAKAFDGLGTTRWASTYSDANWLRVDLGASYDISRVVLNWEAAFGRGYQIQLSADGTNWSNVAVVTNGDGGTDDLTLSGTGRYVRMNGTQRATQWGYSLWELQVFGVPSVATSSSSTPSSTSSSVSVSSSSVPPSSSSAPSSVGSSLSCSFLQQNSWGGGGQFEGSVLYSGAGTRNGWSVYMSFSVPVSNLSIWNAVATQISPTLYRVSNASWNGNIASGQRQAFGFTASYPSTPNVTCSEVVTSSSSSAPSSIPVSSSSSSSLSSSSSSVVSVSSQSSSTAPTQGQFRVTAQGSITKDGAPVAANCGNWFGLEGQHEPRNAAVNPDGAPMELYAGNMWWANTGRTLQQTMTEIKNQGLNMIRLPIAPQTLNAADPQGIGAVLKNHPSIRQANARQAMEDFIKLADRNGIQVLVDIHSCSNYLGWRAGRIDARPPYVDATRPGYEFDREKYSCAETGNPASVTTIHAYNEQKWLADLREIASLPSKLGVTNIVGIDIFNEPWDYTWQDWKTLSEKAYTAINSVNPNLLVFVEGVSGHANSQDGSPTSRDVVPHGSLDSNPNWGENLFEAGSNPINIPKDRVVFSPHVYGPSVFVQKQFMDPAQPNCAELEGEAAGQSRCNIVLNQARLEAGWEEHFGYLRDQGYALVVGEFGGNMDWPQRSNTMNDRTLWSHINQPVDRQWQEAFVTYMKRKKIQACYWSVNPESADTNGWFLHAHDPVTNPSAWGTWTGLDPRKTTLLKNLWNQ